MTKQTAEAQYEGEWNPPEDDYLAWQTIGIPPEKAESPGQVASYLRFGGRISDRVLKQFVWNGSRFDAMGRKLSDHHKDHSS